ncbi:CD225/dispanin family protein [Salininema proteolyticum]|uniref:CD225/dispanin family protein n=1 Tax=Salininema proteolyticum TaxID=1607685 RepID=A0ABV8TX10_9ACTN
MDHRTEAPRRTPPPDHKAVAVLSLVFFLPFGIASIIHSSRVSPQWLAGLHDEALHSSRMAKTWGLWGIAAPFVLGLGTAAIAALVTDIG